VALPFKLPPKETGLVLCVDPGLRCCGVAIFSPSGRLLRAGLPQSSIAARTGIRGARAWAAMAKEVEHWLDVASWRESADNLHFGGWPTKLIVEEQRIDQRTPNADDMLQVNGTAGAIAGIYAASLPSPVVVGVWPETWKGSIPKADMTARIASRMRESPEEDRRIEYEGVPMGLRHNILDAVGIGLYHWDRLKAQKTIHR